MEPESARRETVEQLAEEFVERFRQGERPALSEYTERYPEHADSIRELLPALVMMEQIAPESEDSLGVLLPHDSRQQKAEQPERLGDYRILREIGRGGMGVVYEAEQISLGRHVALKVLPQQRFQDSRQRKRFEREARAAAKLHHTNIVPVFGVGEDDGLHYYVMQFIQGLGLDAVLDELRRLRRPVDKLPVTQGDGPDLPTNPTRAASAVELARGLLTGPFGPLDSASPLTTTEGQPAGADLATPTSVRTANSSVASDTLLLYDFSEAPAGTVVRDLSANGHDAIIRGRVRHLAGRRPKGKVKPR